MKSPSDPSHVCGVAAEIATEAGAMIAAAFRQSMRVEHKRDAHDPVTEHDRLIEAHIRTRLLEAVPGSSFLGEESGSTDAEGRWRWIVDPIDGTANFAAGMPYVCCSIGVAHDNRMVGGIVNAPLLEEHFEAWPGHFVFIDRRGRHTRADPGPSRESEALATGYFPFRTCPENHRQALMRDVTELSQVFAALRTPGACALDLAHTACGHVGVSMATWVKPWDVAAGIYLVEAAGGTVTTWDRGTGLPHGLRPAFVAQAPSLAHTRAVEVFDAATKTWLHDANVLDDPR